MRTMPWNLPRFRIASLCFLLLGLSALAAHAQPTPRKAEKLDEPLSRSVRDGDVDTKRVIIRTIPNGLPSLTGALKIRAHAVLRTHHGISEIGRASCRERV